MVRQIRVLMVVGIVAAAAAALTASVPTFAASSYGCSKCNTVNGNDEYPIKASEADNYSGTGVCTVVWRYNGGGSWTKLARTCTANGTSTGELVASGGPYTGHGEAEKYYEFEYELGGQQWD